MMVIFTVETFVLTIMLSWTSFVAGTAPAVCPSVFRVSLAPRSAEELVSVSIAALGACSAYAVGAVCWFVFALIFLANACAPPTPVRYRPRSDKTRA